MQLSRDQKLGVFFLLFATLLVLIWVPSDVDSGYIEKVRRQISIGDALAPTVAGIFLMIGGLGLVIFGGAQGEIEKPADFPALRFASLLLAIYFISFLAMLFIGPVIVSIANLFTDTEQEYRILRDTVPWKYIGFTFGGTFAVTATISLMEGRLSARSLLVGLMAVAVMIAIYDLPFDDLQLPPNGDV